MSKVHVWYMTVEERLEYIEKHPIRPTEKPQGAAFDNIYIDYKWRGKKAAQARKK
ncbi:hypothetical protein [Neobacillus massiliamazoniensis]|uniref:Uncharacterized protein n=1 Tax=Neobacillus massiliamazoniensis TaxID=1499688 RepID=A0A0U1NQL7_9BACI|nr:hypothetical protein [Neobacillus massiliamazoniensis]CRK80327.1 hypothetical protein BN000_00208 [Neobacillus massiliamazoniensis]